MSVGRNPRYGGGVRWNASVAAGLAVAALAEMLLGGVRSPLVVVCGVGAALALAARGRAPLGAAALSLAAFAVPVVALGRQLPSLGQPPNSFALTAVMLLAAYTTGTHTELRRAVCGLVLVGAVSVLYAIGPGSPRGSTANDILAAALFSAVVPWLAGFAVARQRRARAADRLFEESRAAAAAERARIARDVHDLVAHTVSLMVVQAEAAEALLPTSPERTAESLRAVQAAGRDALGALRRTVAALRSGQPAADQRLDALPALLETVRAAGLPVTVVTDGTPAGLPPEVEEAAYRILQEALTNSLRHSDHSGVVVRVAYAPERLELSVVDEGHPVRRRFPGGHGLDGIRERVAALGGTFDAGPTGEGGYLVHAALPVAGGP